MLLSLCFILEWLSIIIAFTAALLLFVLFLPFSNMLPYQISFGQKPSQ